MSVVEILGRKINTYFSNDGKKKTFFFFRHGPTFLQKVGSQRKRKTAPTDT